MCYYTYGDCPSLLSTLTTTVICKFNNNILDNCINPIEGTEAFLSCNQFYELNTTKVNSSHLCNEGQWNRPIPQCAPVCGLKLPRESSNRSNDQNTSFEYPWHVGIYENKNYKLVCTGTLIAMNLILTAAHCVTSNTVPTSILNEETLVVAGKRYPDYFDKRDDDIRQYSKVNKTEILDGYNASVDFHPLDIAVLVLENPFVPSQTILPACIDFNPLPTNIYLKKKGIITTYTGLSHVLREYEVIFIPNTECLTYIENVFGNFNISNDKRCGTYIKNGTFCYVNDGGGLVFKNESDNRYYITGIISFQLKLQKICDDHNYNTLYTLLLVHEQFLKFKMEEYKMQNCRLPRFPAHGEYGFINRSARKDYYPDYLVPSRSTLALTCNIGYNVSSRSGDDQFNCSNDGQWSPPLGKCVNTNTRQRSLLPNLSRESGLQNNTLPLEKPPAFNYNYIFLIVAVLVLLVVLVTVILLKFKFKKRWALRKDPKVVELDCFLTGNLKRFNPELGIDDQAELLPYNYNYEFPRDKLKLGQLLGSGAFGIVIKADASGINSNEEKTTVAVKMVKDTADNIQIKALISELKIMVHLGQHLNVVNLLGACTQNITNRELLVIVEYCQFGNLYNYLLKNRKNYIDQIDSLTGNIDYSFGSEDLNDVSAVSNNGSIPQESHVLHSSSSDIVENSESNACNNNIQSETKSSYDEGSKQNSKLICTKDLISWSFQLARGMEYLASRKIFHGDLAARNILLTENNVVKICDFGLAKRLYRTANYKKKKDTPLPIKWMAIESIRDLVFSIESDVWSYGIVLWELFSLAQTPYPGIEADERLYHKLLDGYKMASPPYAPKEIYKIMCDCWNVDPASRPSFNKLTGTVGLLLEENVRQHYIDLNDPYFIINTQRLSVSPKNDYLVMLSPDEIQTPRYLILP